MQITLDRDLKLLKELEKCFNDASVRGLTEDAYGISLAIVRVLDNLSKRLNDGVCSWLEEAVTQKFIKKVNKSGKKD